MDLEYLIKNYQSSTTKIASLANVKICMLVGVSGAGKDTIKNRLLATSRYDNFVSYTTRQPRTNNGVAEVDGIDYHFITNIQAVGMLEAGDFIEAKYYAGNIYGTGFATLEKAKSNGRIALNDIEVQGVDEYKKLLPQTIAVFILPPSLVEWQRRLKNRYATDNEFKTIWPERRETAIRELEHALSVSYYHFVINDDLETSVETVDKIANSEDRFYRKDDSVRLLARDMLEEMRDY